MKINLEYPYTEKYTSGYLVSSQGRNTIVLYDSITKTRSSTAYARYLMSINIGRILTSDEEVDHINNIKNDDRIENLQILSHKDNNIKRVVETTIGKKYAKLLCPICSIEFIKAYNQISHKETVTCSRSCGGKISHMKDVSNRKIVLEVFYSTEHLKEPVA